MPGQKEARWRKEDRGCDLRRVSNRSLQRERDFFRFAEERTSGEEEEEEEASAVYLHDESRIRMQPIFAIERRLAKPRFPNGRFFAFPYTRHPLRVPSLTSTRSRIASVTPQTHARSSRRSRIALESPLNHRSTKYTRLRKRQAVPAETPRRDATRLRRIFLPLKRPGPWRCDSPAWANLNIQSISR